MNVINKYFEFDKVTATFKKEIISGLETVFAMSCIFLANLGILSTTFSAIVGTFIMEFVAKVLLAQTSGMSLGTYNFYFTTQLKLDHDQIMTVTMISGLLYLLIIITSL